MKIKLSRAGVIAVRLLEAVVAASDVFPPLKSAAGAALHIAKLIEDFKSSKKEWASFAEHVQRTIALVVQSLSHRAAGDNNEQLKDRLLNLERTLNDIQGQIEAIQNTKLAKRFVEFVKDPKRIADMEKDLSRAISLFSLDSDIQLGQDTSRTVRDLTTVLAELHEIRDAIGRVEDRTSQVHADVKSSIQIANLARLPYAYDATWNPGKICLAGTRQSILTEIRMWALAPRSDGPSGTQILWLTSVPGAGKTTIAHSMAQFLSEEGYLGSAFFFSKEDAERAPKLFSTMACDLASKLPRYKSFLSQTIEEDIGLASAGLIRHFQGLILPFSSKGFLEKQLVIVIDALDEGYSKELVNILTTGISGLPGTLKFIITSRDVDELKAMHHAKNIHHIGFNHLEETSLKDVGILTRRLMEDIVKERELKDWPTEEMLKRLVEKSEGLMIWVVAVCQYLMEVPYPKEDLQDLLEEKLDNGQGVENQTDALYARILLKYAWKNRRFTERYQEVMGCILASRVPLSPAAIQAFQSSPLDIQGILPFFKPLLQAPLEGSEAQPLQVIHKSLHDFLSQRAHQMAEWKIFAINERLHSQHLAKHISEEIPQVPNGIVSEQLWYSCQFWVDHLWDYKQETQLEEEFVTLLQQFIQQKFIPWLELTIAKGTLPNVMHLMNWIKQFHQELLCDLQLPDNTTALVKASNQLKFEGRKQEALSSAQYANDLIAKHGKESLEEFDNRHAACLNNLSIMLSRMGSVQNALPIVKDSVSKYRKLAEAHPGGYKDDLARSLHNLSLRLSQVGERKEALATIREAVEIRRQLVQENSDKYSASLAISLQILSICSSEVGLREEALDTIRECVSLYRLLASLDRMEYDPALASSLNTLSLALHDMNLIDEAASSIKESVEIRQDLAVKKPIVFDPLLAESLGTLSTVLVSIGSLKEALDCIQKSVGLYRELAEENPMGYNLGLAQALSNLSVALNGLGQTQNALASMKEATQLYRELTIQRPGLYKGELAQSLLNMSLLGASEDKEGAFGAIEEAVTMLRMLAKDDSSYNHRLGGALYEMSWCLSLMGLKEEAISPISEAVAIHRALAAKTPSYKPDLAKSLSALGSMMEAGRNDQAVSALEEALVIQKELVQLNPQAFEVDLANTLRTLSTLSMFVGQQTNALDYMGEAADIYRCLVSKNDTAIYKSNFVETLINLSLRLSDMERKDDALVYLKEAVDMSRRIAASGTKPLNNKVDLAIALKYLADGMLELSLRGEALEVLREATSIYRDVAKQMPAVYNASLIDCLRSLSSILQEEKHLDEALLYKNEADELSGN